MGSPSRLVVLVAALTAPMGACEPEGRPCYPGDYVACTCGDGAEGYARCSDDGEAYGACDCTSGVPSGSTTGGAGKAGGGGAGGGDAASGASGGADGGGSLPFMSPCDANEECETGLCHVYNAKGTFCSKPCESASDCPPPSPGCNMMGVCKAP